MSFLACLLLDHITVNIYMSTVTKGLSLMEQKIFYKSESLYSVLFMLQELFKWLLNSAIFIMPSQKQILSYPFTTSVQLQMKTPCVINQSLPKLLSKNSDTSSDKALRRSGQELSQSSPALIFPLLLSVGTVHPNFWRVLVFIFFLSKLIRT